MLLYPISVLSGAVLLYRRAGMLLAGLADAFYAFIIWAVRAGWVPAQGLSDVPYLSPRRWCTRSSSPAWPAARWPSSGPTSRRASRAWQRLEETVEQVADLEELTRSS